MNCEELERGLDVCISVCAAEDEFNVFMCVVCHVILMELKHHEQYLHTKMHVCICAYVYLTVELQCVP